MVYAIQLTIGFRNTARRDAVQSNIITQTAGLPQYGDLVCMPANFRVTDDPSLTVIARFTNQADRDSLWANLDAYLGSGVNGPVTGSLGYIHDCPHDEDVGACTIGPTREW